MNGYLQFEEALREDRERLILPEQEGFFRSLFVYFVVINFVVINPE